MHSMYVDNLIVQGTSAKEVDKALDEARIKFEEAGVHLHPTETAASEMQCLGVDQHGSPPTVTITARRYWKMWHVIDFVLKKNTASGIEVECLIGHLTFGVLVRRPLLSVFRSVYDFMRSLDRTRVQRVLWNSVRRELEMARGLLI